MEIKGESHGSGGVPSGLAFLTRNGAGRSIADHSLYGFRVNLPILRSGAQWENDSLSCLPWGYSAL